MGKMAKKGLKYLRKGLFCNVETTFHSYQKNKVLGSAQSAKNMTLSDENG